MTPRSEPIPAERVFMPADMMTLFLHLLLQSAKVFLSIVEVAMVGEESSSVKYGGSWPVGPK